MKFTSKNATAGLLALALVVGATPANALTGGLFGGTAITASAATKTIEVGTIFAIGDTIDFGTSADIVYDDEYDLVVGLSGKGVLGYTQYYEPWGQHIFTLNDDDLELYISGDNKEPTGLEVMTGNGDDCPYVFAVYYGEIPDDNTDQDDNSGSASAADPISGNPFSGGATIIDEGTTNGSVVGAQFKIGDTVDFGNGAYIITDDTPGYIFSDWFTGAMTLSYSGYYTDFNQHTFSLSNGDADSDVTIYITSENEEQPTGVKVTGGDGTASNPYTLAVYYEETVSTEQTLPNGKYVQTATNGDVNYTRYVFVEPQSAIEGKSKAVFTATYNGTEKTFDTTKYYTELTTGGIHYTTESEDSVIFVVTITGVPADDVANEKLVCNIAFE